MGGGKADGGRESVRGLWKGQVGSRRLRDPCSKVRGRCRRDISGLYTLEKL